MKEEKKERAHNTIFIRRLIRIESKYELI